MLRKLLHFSCIVIALSSCGEEPVAYETYERPDTAATDSIVPQAVVNADTVARKIIKMAYQRRQDNTITIKVWINGMGLDMIFDTGASTTLISATEARYLYDKGKLRQEDVKKSMHFRNASGDISEGTVINLHEVALGDKVLKDVEAVVVNNQSAPLLLGQSILSRFAKVSVDRDQGVVVFEE